MQQGGLCGIRLGGGVMDPLSVDALFLVKDSEYVANRELVLIPGAAHTDLYDGGGKNAIPFDRLETFFEEYMR